MPRAIVITDTGTRQAVDLEDGRYAAFNGLRNNSHLQALASAGPLGTRDAGEAMGFVISQLAYTEQQTYERMYTPLQYEQLIPISYEAGEWATTIRYEMMDMVGRGRRSSGRGKDIPHADVAFAEKSIPVVNGSIGYGYSQEELRQSTYLRRPLPTARLNAAMEGYRRHLNDVALNGEADLPGLYNNSFVPVANAATTNWETATADQILAVMNTGILSVYQATGFNDFPTDVVLPPTVLSILTSRRASPGGDGKTILAYLKENNIAKTERNIDLKISAGFGLETAGVGSTRRILYYVKNPNRLVMHVPMPIRFLAPQFAGLDVDIPGEYKYSGVTWRYPKSALYQDGM